MRIGIIDQGTNSVRFDVHQVGPDGYVRQLHREKIMVRLGQGVFIDGRLDKNAVQRTLHAFIRFKRIATSLRVDKIIAFGTSALREVANRERFLELIQARTGINLRVISGVEEAKLIALGVLANERIGKGKFALIDIGGGSTEISIGSGKEVLHSASFPLGTARLQQLFLKESPPSPDSIEELRHVIRNTLYQEIILNHWPKVDRVIGSSGTIRAIAKILKKTRKGSAIEREKLHALVENMSAMSVTDLLGIPGMEAKRVDMILGGTILFEECMNIMGAKKAIATEFSLRDGILEEELSLIKLGKRSHLALHLPDLYQKAVFFGGSEPQLKRVVKLGSGLFQALRRLHGLPSHWEVYLTAAIILRDTGEAINLAQHETHSYYIIKHADLAPMEEWELEFIAQLCLYHERGKVDLKNLSFARSKKEKTAFIKLLALLRLVDALDCSPEAEIQLRGVNVSRREVKIKYSGKRLTGLESITVDIRQEFFEKAFKKSVSAVKVGGA